MINRQLIRLKAIQVFYAYSISGDKTIEEAEKEYATSLERAHDLYLYLLNFLIDIRRHAEVLADTIEARNDRLGIHSESISAERALADNKWLTTISENCELLEYRNNHNDQNDAEYALVKKLTKQILEHEDFLLYLKRGDFSPEADQEIMRSLYKNLLAVSEDFEPLLEDRCLYWNDDKAIIDTFVIKTIKRIKPNGDTEQPLLPAWGEEDDKKFATHLFSEALKRKDETYTLIQQFTSDKWQIERVAFMDIVIMQMALAEIIGVEGVPVSVSINEYINMAKWYSTPQSSAFINAMLDTICKHLRSERKLLKP